MVHFVKCLSPEVALYLYKSTMRTCMKYCFHVWAGTPSCYLDILDKVQKRQWRIQQVQGTGDYFQKWAQKYSKYLSAKVT